MKKMWRWLAIALLSLVFACENKNSENTSQSKSEKDSDKKSAEDASFKVFGGSPSNDNRIGMIKDVLTIAPSIWLGGGCTAFEIKNPSGKRCLMSAGHCSGSNAYYWKQTPTPEDPFLKIIRQQTFLGDESYMADRDHDLRMMWTIDKACSPNELDCTIDVGWDPFEPYYNSLNVEDVVEIHGYGMTNASPFSTGKRTYGFMMVDQVYQHRVVNKPIPGLDNRACPGDSGSPLIHQIDPLGGQKYAAGVHSAGSRPCHNLENATNIDSTFTGDNKVWLETMLEYYCRPMSIVEVLIGSTSLTVLANETGKVVGNTVDDTINCGGAQNSKNCEIESFTPITLVAVPEPGYGFVRWEKTYESYECSCVGKGINCEIDPDTMELSRTRWGEDIEKNVCTAVFGPMDEPPPPIPVPPLPSPEPEDSSEELPEDSGEELPEDSGEGIPEESPEPTPDP